MSQEPVGGDLGEFASVKSAVCPCRSCSLARSGMGGFAHWYLSSDEDRIARACKQFVEDEPRWTEYVWLYTVDWLEREIDDVLGLTHARFTTEQLKAQAA